MKRLAAATLLTTACSYFTPEVTPPRDGDAGLPTLHGCAPAAFVDRTAASAARVVGFNGAEGSPPLRYAPACMTVSAGQEVTFVGAFMMHPLSPGVIAGPDAGASPGNPIPRTAAGDRVAVRFPTAGLFPYYCEVHGTMGMQGVVRVVAP